MFGWLSSQSKSILPETTALQIQRSRQIEQLKTFNKNVSEIQRDTEYCVNSTVNGTNISIQITLPPLFPQEKPLVKVSPRLQHAWVNDQMILVGCSGINNFMVHSDLGKVIREVVEEFHRNSPTMLPQQFSVYGGYTYESDAVTAKPQTTSQQAYGYPATADHTPSAAEYDTENAPGSRSQLPSTTYPLVSAVSLRPNYGLPHPGNSGLPQKQSLVGGYKMPELPTSLTPHLQGISVLELQELLDDEEKLLELVSNLPEIQHIAGDREQFTQVNEHMANENLCLKPLLEGKKKMLLEKYDTFNEVKQYYDNYAHKQDILRQQYNPIVIEENLKVAAQQAEEQSEALAEGFLDGNISVEVFKKTYMDKRKLSHLRHAKVERLVPTKKTGLY